MSSQSGVLEQRVALISGGARGIGFAIAQTMVMEGARVLIVDHGCALDGSPQDPVAAEAAADRLNAIREGAALAMTRNLAEPGCAMAAVTRAREEFGALDILVNNASIQRPGAIDTASAADLEAVLHNNLLAPLMLASAAAPVMRDQARSGRLPGAIIQMASVAGFTGAPDQAAEATAKAGLLGMTRAIAHDMRRYGITCNAIIPFAATRQTQALPEQHPDLADYKARALQVPARYVANTATWLASAQGAGVTGQVFGVRGRELFLFSGARPDSRVFLDKGAFDVDTIAHLVHGKLSAEFAPMDSEADLFNCDPLL